MTPHRLFPLLLLLLTVLAYHNCFQGVFVYDDRLAILKNPTIRQLWPPGDALTPPAATPVAARPVVNLSFALNHAISGFHPWSYHAFNLVIHVVNGLLLFRIIRRTVADDGFALAGAGLWLVHPLQTESVMYVTQRTELLFAFFLLLTLYAAIRSACGSGSVAAVAARGHAPPQAALRERGYSLLAVAACALGMGSKETMVVAPVLVAVYDRIFLRRCRPKLYLALAACWLILVAWQVGQPRAASAGFGFAHLSSLDYALTQCGVIVHYLRLVVWPWPLAIDYEDWPIARSLAIVWPQALLVVSLLAATGGALRCRPRLGYLGVWFFLILAPTSSFLPIATELVAERRMYLPLAAVILGLVLIVRKLRGWRLVLAVGASVCLLPTISRNRQYHSEVAILESTVAARPNNARARTNLGNAWLRQGDPARALPQYAAAVQLMPHRAEVHNNLGVALAAVGETDHALAHYGEAVRLDPRLLDARFNLGVALVEQGRYAKAIPHLEAALEMQPDLPDARRALATATAARPAP